jgi:hypothetical protein
MKQVNLTPFFRSNLKAAGLFALVGPPFGALLWILASTRTAPYSRGFFENVWSYSLTMVIAIPLSWAFGLVPAVLTGLLSAVSWSQLHGSLATRKLVRTAIGTFWGYMATYGFKWLAFGLEDLPGPLPLEVIGAISGFACALLAPAAWVKTRSDSLTPV